MPAHTHAGMCSTIFHCGSFSLYTVQLGLNLTCLRALEVISQAMVSIAKE